MSNVYKQAVLPSEMSSTIKERAHIGSVNSAHVASSEFCISTNSTSVKIVLLESYLCHSLFLTEGTVRNVGVTRILDAFRDLS
jgi:hypothetical protein